MLTLIVTAILEPMTERFSTYRTEAAKLRETYHAVLVQCRITRSVAPSLSRAQWKNARSSATA